MPFPPKKPFRLGKIGEIPPDAHVIVRFALKRCLSEAGTQNLL